MKKKMLALGCVLTLQAPWVASAADMSENISHTKAAISKMAEVSSKTNSISQVKVSKEKAIDIAKKFITIPNEFKQQSISYQSNWYPGDKTVWNITWSKQDEQGSYGSISVTVDAETGKVISMNHWDDNRNKTFPPKFEYEEAKQVAEQFVQEKVPDKAKQVILSKQNFQKPPLQGEAFYSYQFMRTENGIPFVDQYIMVTVDGDGNVTAYEYRWNDEIEIPNTEQMLSLADATKIIKDTFPLKLQYQASNYYMGQKEPSYRLAYGNTNHYMYIDAITGKWLDWEGNVVHSSDYDISPEPISNETGKQPNISNKEISQEQAITIAKKHFIVPDEVKLENAYYSDATDYQPYPTWSLHWVKGEYEYSVHASVNAKTGEIISYGYEDPKRYAPVTDDQPVKQVVNYEEAKEKAIEKLKEVIPSKTNKLTFDQLANQKPENPEKVREFHFTFHRLVDGVSFMDQHVSISVSAETGNITQFYQNWNDNIEFPEKNDVVSLETAKDVFFEQYTIEPKYVYIDRAYDNKSEEPKVKLVYQMVMKQTDEMLYLDAIKGKWASLETGEVIREKVEPKDIAGHKAEKALELLIDYNAIEVNEDGYVKPEQDVTRGEMVKMLMLVTNPDPYYYKMNYMYSSAEATFKDVSKSSPYYAYVESAVQQGLIEKSESGKFNPEEKISREEIAELIVKALQFDKLAEYESLFNINFKDKEEIEHKAEAAIVHHLGILPAGNDQTFGPTLHVSRADAAQAFYEFLQVRGKLSNNYIPYRY